MPVKHVGGAWKVAYADFVTAMMAFFLVMWITAQSDQVKEAIAHHFSLPFDSAVPSELHKRQTGSQLHESVLPKSDDGLRYPSPAPSPHGDDRDPLARRPRMLTLREGDRTRTGTVVFFAGDSPELDAAGQERLARLVPWIAGKPHKLEIRGHASRQPLPAGSPSQGDAWQLSYARCLAVMKLLTQHGIPAERLRLSQAGGNEPGVLDVIDHEQLPEGRVEIYLLDELVQDFPLPLGEGRGEGVPECSPLAPRGTAPGGCGSVTEEN